MTLELRLTPRAEADLEEIWDYTEAEWSAAQAERYLDGLSETFLRLCDMPGIGREYTEIVPPVRIMPHGSHVILYRSTVASLDVIRVLGGRQDWLAVIAALE